MKNIVSTKQKLFWNQQRRLANFAPTKCKTDV